MSHTWAFLYCTEHGDRSCGVQLGDALRGGRGERAVGSVYTGQGFVKSRYRGVQPLSHDSSVDVFMKFLLRRSSSSY